MKTSYIYIILFTFFLVGSISAQQDPSYIFYRYNMNFVNSAYAGAEQQTQFGMNFRSQWSGVVGGPETQSFMASTYMGRNLGLGVSVINDRTFIETQTSAAIDFSYKVKWDEQTNLYFGLKVSGNSYNVNTAGLTTFGIGSDPSLMDIEGGITPNVGVGAYLKSKKLSLSLAAPKILKPKRLEQESGLAKLGRNKMHINLMGAYDFDLNEKLVFRPSSMIRYIEQSPLSIDFTASLHYNDIFGFGAAYRLNEGVAGFILINIEKSFDIGYAYEAPLSSALNSASNGTHEVFLKLRL